MLPDFRYEETATQLLSGDALVLLTDGALEVTNTADEELGRDGLERLWREESSGSTPASANLARIEERLLAFSNQIHLPDDLTLFKITRRS
jgi:serine phosphatase RsbU (regulator of sigma subunit)